jgi:hypothetical protein
LYEFVHFGPWFIPIIRWTEYKRKPLLVGPSVELLSNLGKSNRVVFVSYPVHLKIKILQCCTWSSHRTGYEEYSMVLCSLVEVHQCFRWTYCLHLQGQRVSQARNQLAAGNYLSKNTPRLILFQMRMTCAWFVLGMLYFQNWNVGITMFHLTMSYVIIIFGVNINFE